MKTKKNGTNRDMQCTGNERMSHGISRRHFLQISGGTAAAVAGGMAYLLMHDKDVAQPAVVDVPVAVHTSAGHFREEWPPVTPEQATYFRHLRHRRQHRDGVYDITFDSHEECERNCIGALYAHELRLE